MAARLLLLLVVMLVFCGLLGTAVEGKGTYNGRDRSAGAGRIGPPCTAGEEGG